MNILKSAFGSNKIEENLVRACLIVNEEIGKCSNIFDLGYPRSLTFSYHLFINYFPFIFEILII